VKEEGKKWRNTQENKRKERKEKEEIKEREERESGYRLVCSAKVLIRFRPKYGPKRTFQDPLQKLKKR